MQWTHAHWHSGLPAHAACLVDSQRRVHVAEAAQWRPADGGDEAQEQAALIRGHALHYL